VSPRRSSWAGEASGLAFGVAAGVVVAAEVGVELSRSTLFGERYRFEFLGAGDGEYVGV
jgi:hypothetical protein